MSNNNNNNNNNNMLFKDFTFVWEPYRSPREESKLQALLNSTAKKMIEKDMFSSECRLAVRRLLYACVGDQNLLDVLDGFLVPPPYKLESLYDRPISREEIEAAMDIIPPDLDPVIAILPFNLAIGTGVYDARLRAAVRRLCWLFAIPFDIIEAHELTLMNALLLTDDVPVAVIDKSLQEKKQMVQSHKEGKKSGVRRIAAIGAFAAVGGAALVVTGGLVAPLVAPAFGAFVSAATATVGTMGAIGGAVLGGTAAVSAVFAGMIGVATHATALIALITPALTAANVTAIFGIGGVSLAGYRAYRRTAESDVFMIRSITEIEELPKLIKSDDVLPSLLSDGQMAQWRDAHQRLGKEDKGQDMWMNVQDVLEETARGGIVVPAHTRAVAMSNVAAKEHFKERMRCLTFALQCSLPEYRLELKALRLLAGTWGLVPPKIIPEDTAGVFVCLNRFARPTGCGCVVCYHIRPISNVANPTLRLWVLVELSFFGNLSFAVAITDTHETLQPKKMFTYLENTKFDSDVTLTFRNFMVKCCFSPLPFVMICNLKSVMDTSDASPSSAVFPVKELHQRTVEIMKAVRERRRIGVSLVNTSKHIIRVLKCEMINGVQSHKTPHLITTISSQQALLGIFTNAEMSLKGAEAFFILEIVNSDAEEKGTPILHRRFYIKLQFEVTALNSINVDCVATLSLQGLIDQPMCLKKLPDKEPQPISMPESFVWSAIRVNSETFMVELCVEDFVERIERMKVKKCPSLTIGVTGFVTIFDERRPQQDQQVALWAPFLSKSRLFGTTEGYVVHWEDEYQTKFGRAIGIGSSSILRNQLGTQVISRAKGAAKHHLLQGGIFVGFHAFNAFKGTLTLPMYAIWATGAIDNAFATLTNRASYAGKDLAQALLDPQKGNRPVSLIGFGFGARVIVKCLHELYRVNAFNIIENVYLMGSIVSSSRSLWCELRRVVAGRLVNIYSRSDWMLWLMYKANEAALRPMAGISPINVPGVENLDVTFLVDSHFDYAMKLKEIINVIPERPTRQMYEKSLGSPGALVLLDSIHSVSKRMIASMGSFLGDAPCATLAITNRIVSDIKNISAELRCISRVVSGGYFDFEPPDFIPSSRCAVCGVVGDDVDGGGDDDGEDPVVGSVSYVLPLDFASVDLLLIVMFFIPPPGGGRVLLFASADMQIVKRLEGGCETDSERWRRLMDVCNREAENRERIQVRCESAKQVSRGEPLSLEFVVDFDGVFSDGTKEAIFHVTTSYEGDDSEETGVTVDITALLTQSSTLAHRRKFTADLFDEIYQVNVKRKPALSFPLEQMRHIMQEFSDTFASHSNTQQGRNVTFQPIMFINCSELTLFYTGATASSSSSDGGGGVGSFSSGEMGLEWIRYPPQELPSHHCALIVIRRCSSPSIFPSNGAVLDVFSLACETGRCEVQLIAPSPPTDAPHAGNKDGGGGIEVACHCEADLSASGGGNVSVTNLEMNGVVFKLVSIAWLTEKQTVENTTVQSLDIDDSSGWILID